MAYITRKTVNVQTYGDYPSYATTDDKTVTRLLHLLSNNNKVHNEQSALSVRGLMPEYKIDNRTVYDILDQICKNIYLYPYVKQHKSKRDGRGAFMPSTSGGWVQTMLIQQHQKLRLLCRCSPTMEERKPGTGRCM